LLSNSPLRNTHDTAVSNAATVRPMAVIDGQLHFVGDSIGGWTLTDVQSRSVMLRSPTKALVTIDMPLLTGSTAMPAVTAKHR